MLNIAIFVSGTGSNMDAIIKASKNGDIAAKVSLVICNNPQAKAIAKAEAYGVKVVVVNHRDFANREEFEKKILEELAKEKLDLICLAGFMRLFSPYFIKHCATKLINIHPSLLPKHKGAHAIEDAFKAREKETGCTVHYVIEEMDAGEIILQRKVAISADDTLESLTEKIHKEEHVAYVEAIKILSQ